VNAKEFYLILYSIALRTLSLSPLHTILLKTLFHSDNFAYIYLPLMVMLKRKCLSRWGDFATFFSVFRNN